MIYQPTAPASSASTMLHGHLSPPPSRNRPNPIMASESESELSEAMDPASTILPSLDRDDEQDAEDTYRSSASGSSHNEDAMGSDDPDYDMEDSAPAAQPHIRSSSPTSSKLGKRKASVDEDDFMLENPELYGLRRSVRHPPCQHSCHTDRPSTGPCSSITSHRRSPLNISDQCVC